MFIVHLKNPTAVQGYFWIVFVNLWIFCFVLLSEIVYQTLPGKDNAKILVCYGKVQTEMIEVPVKMNWHILVTGYSTVFLHITFGIFQMLFKRYNQKKHKEFEQFKSSFGKGFNNEDMFLFAAALVLMFTLILGIVNVSLLDVIDPRLLDTYPYYIMVYVLDEIHPACVLSFTLIIYLLKHEKIRKDVWEEILGLFLSK